VGKTVHTVNDRLDLKLRIPLERALKCLARMLVERRKVRVKRELVT